MLLWVTLPAVGRKSPLLELCYNVFFVRAWACAGEGAYWFQCAVACVARLGGGLRLLMKCVGTSIQEHFRRRPTCVTTDVCVYRFPRAVIIVKWTCILWKGKRSLGSSSVLIALLMMDIPPPSTPPFQFLHTQIYCLYSFVYLQYAWNNLHAIWLPIYRMGRSWAGIDIGKNKTINTAFQSTYRDLRDINCQIVVLSSGCSGDRFEWISDQV